MQPDNMFKLRKYVHFDDWLKKPCTCNSHVQLAKAYITHGTYAFGFEIIVQSLPAVDCKITPTRVREEDVSTTLTTI